MKLDPSTRDATVKDGDRFRGSFRTYATLGCDLNGNTVYLKISTILWRRYALLLQFPLLYVTPRLEELQLFRSQQEFKSLPESLDQKEHSVKKTGREKRKSDSNISYEQSPTKRQKNTPLKPKKVHEREKGRAQTLAEENEGGEPNRSLRSSRSKTLSPEEPKDSQMSALHFYQILI